MTYKGFKVEKEGYTLEVTGVESVTDNISSISYVVKRGSNELTDGFIYAMKNDNISKRLNEVLDAIIKAVKRVAQT